MSAWDCDACMDGENLIDAGTSCVTCGRVSDTPSDEDSALAEMQAALAAAKLKKDGPANPDDLLSKFEALLSEPDPTPVQLDPNDGALDVNTGLPPLVDQLFLVLLDDEDGDVSMVGAAVNQATAALLADTYWQTAYPGEHFAWLDAMHGEGANDCSMSISQLPLYDSYPGNKQAMSIPVQTAQQALANPPTAMVLPTAQAVQQHNANAPRPVFGGNP